MIQKEQHHILQDVMLILRYNTCCVWISLR